MIKQGPFRPDDYALGPRPPLGTEAACELLISANARAVILVEGWSDQAALESLALIRGWDLTSEGIGVVPMGGITNIGKFARALGPRGLRVHLACLCDAAEEPYVTRTLHRMGLGGTHTREEREALGFYVCEADLEDELIRALGTAAVERVPRALDLVLAHHRRRSSMKCSSARSGGSQIAIDMPSQRHRSSGPYERLTTDIRVSPRDSACDRLWPTG